jgi:hypothetical protein
LLSSALVLLAWFGWFEYKSIQTSNRRTNNLLFLSLSFGSYVDFTGHLPRNGKLSWRVDLLQYSADPIASALYKRFHLDEPWDSPHNKQLIGEIPSFLQNPETPKGQTCYLGVSGEGCAFDDGKLQAAPKHGQQARIAVVFCKESCPWTKPQDVPVKDVENGTCIRWDSEGAASALTWEGGGTHWLKKYPEGGSTYKPLFRYDRTPIP